MDKDNTWVLSQLSAQIGFSITESRLSPQVRQKIGLLSNKRYELSRLALKASSKEAGKKESIKYMAISLAIGILLVALISSSIRYLGILAWVASGLIYLMRYRTIQREVQSLRTQMATVSSELDSSIRDMEKDILRQLSEVHKQDICPKEVTKEVVKIPCRYCGHLVEITESKCPYCEAPVS